MNREVIVVVKATGNNPSFSLRLKSDFINAIVPLVIGSLLLAICLPLCCMCFIFIILFLFIFCIVMIYLLMQNIKQI